MRVTVNAHNTRRPMRWSLDVTPVQRIVHPGNGLDVAKGQLMGFLRFTPTGDDPRDPPPNS